MSNVEYSPEQIQEFANRDIVFGTRARCPDVANDEITRWEYSTAGYINPRFLGTERAMVSANINKSLLRIPHNNRVIGLLNHINEDGSYDVTLYGSETISFNNMTQIYERRGVSARALYYNDNFNFSSAGDYVENLSGFNDHTSEVFAWGSNGHGSGSYGNITAEESYDYTPKWNPVENTGMSPEVQLFRHYSNITLPEDMRSLTLDTQGSVRVGIGKLLANLVPIDLEMSYGGGDEIYDCIAGNVWECCMDLLQQVAVSLNGSEPLSENIYKSPLYNYVGDQVTDTDAYALMFKPYNLIMTENPNAIQPYLNAGTIPSDAIIFPFDPDEFPLYIGDSTVPTSDSPSGDDIDEDGDPISDMHPTSEPTPDYTAQRLTNNNLYWLTAGQLEEFINWFWTDCGDYLDVNNLWARIQGLFNNLASAIINIRYMPVDPIYIGGYSATNSIIIGNVSHSLQNSVNKISRNNPTKRTLGHISIKETIKSIKTVNGFTNYTPYSQLSLYLPFHGFMDIDNDIFMGHNLTVKCLYDIISGTIQYEIYRDSTMVYVIPCKMAVDIPITLQAKGDRDSAIFSNITGLAGSLVSGGIAIGTGNPIGLVMGASNVANGVSSMGSESAPMTLKGTPQETGAFFSSNKCAIYIKRPVYNRPKMYKSRVGYPCNKGYTLSDDDLSGFTQIHNPTINFSGNTITDDGNTKTIKPLQSEIAEIYDYLTKGVIL